MPRPRSLKSRVPAPRVAVIVSRYNASITDRLLDGARAAHPDPAMLEVISAPGSFELPALALAAARSGRFQGIVALGCLIKGETIHDRVIADAVAQGLVQVTIATGVPAAFGVVTADTPAQARARAGGSHGNKGADAMTALLETLRSIDELHGRSTEVAVTTKPDKALHNSKPRSRR